MALFFTLPALNGVEAQRQAVITVEFVQPTVSPPALPERSSPKKRRPAPSPDREPAPRPEPSPETLPKTQAVQAAEETAPSPATHSDSSPYALPKPVPIFELTAMPRFIHRQTPEYPVAMKVQGREGTVKLAVLVDAKGAIRQVTVLQSAGQEFDRAAVAALEASTFEPGKVNDKYVPVLMKIPVSFKLQ